MGTEKRTCFLQGNEACAEGAIAAGARFFAGYPITPATEIAEEMSRLLPKIGGAFIQMEDELACMGAVVGASLAGTKSMTATSGPGFSLVQENIGYAVMVEAPCVIVDVMRGGPSTGLPTLSGQGDVMQARWGTHGDHAVIVLAPSNVSEMYTLTIACFNYSEKYRVPAILLADAIVGHMREKIDLPADGEITIIDRKKVQPGLDTYKPYQPEENGVPLMTSFGDGYRTYITGCTHDEAGVPRMTHPEISDTLVKRLVGKVEDNRDNIVMYDAKYTDDADVVVIAYGSVSRSADAAVETMRHKGCKVGYFRPITLFPSPDKEIVAALANAKTVIIPEINIGQYANEIYKILGAHAMQRKVVQLNQATGELIRPELICDYIEKECCH